MRSLRCICCPASAMYVLYGILGSRQGRAEPFDQRPYAGPCRSTYYSLYIPDPDTLKFCPWYTPQVYSTTVGYIVQVRYGMCSAVRYYCACCCATRYSIMPYMPDMMYHLYTNEWSDGSDYEDRARGLAFSVVVLNYLKNKKKWKLQRLCLGVWEKQKRTPKLSRVPHNTCTRTILQKPLLLLLFILCFCRIIKHMRARSMRDSQPPVPQPSITYILSTTPAKKERKKGTTYCLSGCAMLPWGSENGSDG